MTENVGSALENENKWEHVKGAWVLLGREVVRCEGRVHISWLRSRLRNIAGKE